MSAVTSPYPASFEGYEARRPQLVRWTKQHYIDAFGLDPGVLLDAGCGEGFWADIFSEFGFLCSGFDLEPEYIANGRKKYPHIRLDVGDVFEELPYEPESFDYVFTRGIPQLYTEDLTDFKRVTTRLLDYVRYGGTLLVSAYSDGSGKPRSGLYGGEYWHHPHQAFVDAANAAGVVTHWLSVGRYCQIAVRS
jgi:SAM-dependent methyltransferase